MIDFPTHQVTAQQTWHLPAFQPGKLEQDIYTIPIELGLIGLSSLPILRLPREHALFPFLDQNIDESNKDTTYTRSALLPYIFGIGSLVFGHLYLSNNNFPIWTHLRGFAHAILLSELSVSLAKVIVQEKRPNYTAQLKANNGRATPDSVASFYSDHANQAFVFTTYTSLLMFEYSNSTLLSIIYTSSAVSAASIISYSRITDHAHHMHDVIIGALMGTTIAGLTFFRVQDRINSEKTIDSQLNFSFNPGMMYDQFNRFWYFTNLEVKL